MNDAAGQKGTATLQRKVVAASSAFSEDYEEVTEDSAQVTYPGHLSAGEYWYMPDETNGLHMRTSPFHVSDYDLRGAIEWFKVDFRYALPDGDSDSIMSDEFPLWHGTYIGEPEAFLGGSGFFATFPLDTALVDPAKITGSGTIKIGSTEFTMPTFTVDGDEITVGCGMEDLAAKGLSLAYNGTSYPITLKLLYEDYDGLIYWEDSAVATITTPNYGSYILGGWVEPLPPSGTIGPEGFVAKFALDSEVVGLPSDTQPYEGGKTLTVDYIYLVQGNSGSAISADCTFYPVESPYLAVTYHAPSDEPLSGSYRVDVDLSFNDPNAEPPVVDLLDYGSATFTAGVEIFGSGGFEHIPSSYLGGSIELLNGILPSDLEDFSFTIKKNGSTTDDFDPNGHKRSGADGSDGWLGFEFSTEYDDLIPTLDLSATYTVIAHATYHGAVYDSDPYTLSMPAAPAEPTVTLHHIYLWDQVTHLQFAYEVTANDATDLVASAEIYPASNPEMGYTADAFYGEGVAVIDLDAVENTAFLSGGIGATIALEYELDGAHRSETFTLSGTPASQGTLQLKETTYHSGDAESMSVSSELQFLYPSSYAHSFSPEIWQIDLSFKNGSATVGTTTIWSGGGDGPSSFEGPTASGGSMVYTCYYSTGLALMDYDGWEDADAFCLTFYFAGDASYETGSGTMLFDVQTPASVTAGPFELDGGSGSTPVNPISSAMFEFREDEYFSGSIALIDDFDSDELTAFSVTVAKSYDGVSTNVTSAFAPLEWSVFEDGGYFIGVDAGNLITHQEGATYTATIHCTYMGEEFNSGPYDVSFIPA